MSKTRKEKLIELRKQGHSYSYISKKTGLSKGTLSYHLSEIPFEPNEETKKRVADGELKSAQTKHRQKMESIKEAHKEAKKDIGKLTKRDLFMLGLGLYLGDGTKGAETVRISNSNPEIIQVAGSWFRKICKAKNKNLAVGIHAYPDVDKNKALDYWSKITKTPKKQFHKVSIDKRRKTKKKRNKLSYGTCHLYVNACNNEELGVKLHRKIMGWIKATLDQI